MASPVSKTSKTVSGSTISMASTGSTAPSKTFFMDPFGLRQFNNPDYLGTQVHWDPSDFEDRVEQAFKDGAPLVDGYAPFCKHIFIKNFCDVKCGYTKITP